MIPITKGYDHRRTDSSPRRSPRHMLSFARNQMYAKMLTAGKALLAQTAVLWRELNFAYSTRAKNFHNQNIFVYLWIFFALSVIYAVWFWQINWVGLLIILPPGIILFTWIVGSIKSASVLAGIMAIFLLLGIRESVNPLLPNWEIAAVTFFDLMVFAGSFLLLGLMIRLIYQQETIRIEKLARSAKFGELSKGLFHDLMSPLASLATQTQYLRVLSESQLKILEKDLGNLIETGRRLEKFMIHLRRCLEDTVNLDDSWQADLAAELATVCHMTNYMAKINQVQVMVKSEGTTLVKIHPIRLNQVFLNLLHNAIEACAAQKSREVPRTVSIEANHASNGSWRIAVTDNGCGMTVRENRLAMRRPFSSKKNGHGYGLMIANRIITKELRGRISFVSRLGIGTTFTVTIPSSALVKTQSAASEHLWPPCDTDNNHTA